MKSFLKRLLWNCGALHLYHHVRNRHTLTVVQFHRVLPDGSQEYRASNREYALTVSEFDACLRFCKAHYNPVSLHDVVAAARGERHLPDRAVLISFDDGWEDNVRYAQPLLAKHGLRATMFVNIEAIEQDGKRWWQDALVEVYENTPEVLRNLVDEPVFYRAARHFAALDLHERLSAIAGNVKYDPVARQMLDIETLPGLDTSVWDVGSHGMTHVPFTFAADSSWEQTESRSRLQQWLGMEIDALAYPHGRYDSRIISEGHEAGYTALMSSDARLNDGKALPVVMGRIHVPSDAVRDQTGRISSMALAYFLWVRDFQPSHGVNA